MLQPNRGPLVILILALGVVSAGPVAANVPETEPNNSPATADVVPTGANGDWGGPAAIENGTFDEDWWKVTGVHVGDLLFAYINDDNPFSDGEPWLIAYATDGTTPVEAYLPERLAGAVIPLNGDVYMQVREQGNNDNLYYSLLQFAVPSSDQAPELEPNGTRAQATPLSAGMMTGVVNGSDVDFYSFTITDVAQTWVTVIVDNDPDDDGDYTQTVLDLIDNTGATIAYRADDYLAASNIAESFSAPYLGTFYLKIAAGTWSEDTDYRFVLLVNGRSPSAAEPIFSDGFETGNTSGWSSSAP